MRHLTDFHFYKNTPFTDFSNTVLFESNEERDNYFRSSFDTSHYTDNRGFNFIRDRGTIRIDSNYFNFRGTNYCSFVSGIEPNMVYYAYVINYTYINDEVIEVEFLIDGIMTYCQGQTLNTFNNLSVARKHLNRNEYNERVSELKMNDDVLKTYTKRYTHDEKLLFDGLDVLMQVSCNLQADFGTVDDPKIETSEGITFDKITSPVNLYVVKRELFNDFMEKLSPYAWITQNIRSVSLIPSILLEGKLQKVNMTSETFDGLYKLQNNGTTNYNQFDTALLDISKSMEEMYEIFDLDEEEEKHLLRNEYTTTEIYTYNGQQLFVDNGDLSEKYGLFIRSKYVSGHHNEVALYIDNYKSDEDVDGAFLNDAIFIREFDDVPILVDNYNLAMSKSANQRQLAESKLVSNRLGNITDGGSDPESKFYDASSLITNFSPMNFFGKFVDEYEFYRTQQAEHKDMALNTPTITSQSHGNALGIANDFFGVTVKHAQPNKKEWDKVRTYYNMFGFLVNDENAKLDVFSHTVCNYVKFTGQFMIENADIAIIEMMKAQFENGVRFWHYNGKSRPMEQDPLLNKMRD